MTGMAVHSFTPTSSSALRACALRPAGARVHEPHSGGRQEGQPGPSDRAERGTHTHVSWLQSSRGHEKVLYLHKEHSCDAAEQRVVTKTNVFVSVFLCPLPFKLLPIPQMSSCSDIKPGEAIHFSPAPSFLQPAGVLVTAPDRARTT